MSDAMSRRGFLAFGAVAVATAAFAEPAFAVPRVGRREIHLLNEHTDEALNVIYWSDGGYRLDAMVKVNRFLRDHHTNQIRMMDPHLLDQLFTLRQRLGIRQPFHVISAYRSPVTNMMLYREGAGVAKHSLHISGRAVDIRVPGYRLGEVRKIALSMQAGGVGYYPRADFIHLDTGDVRQW